MNTVQRALFTAAMAVMVGSWMAETRGDGTNPPPSAGPIPRFTIQADTNCVVDNLTGLVWARNANLSGTTQTWAQAIAFCKDLIYGGHSDWRLPHISELQGLMNTNYNRPMLSNAEGTAQWKENDPFTRVREYDKGVCYYWATITTEGEPVDARVSFFSGYMDLNSDASGAGFVWPVRGNSRGGASPPAFGEPYLVKDGQPFADIVISGKPPRTVKLAALELQAYLEKISGARLAITAEPGTNAATHIYVGRSAETDRLKVTDEGLEHGAFKMVSGANWLALVGHDSEYAPAMPYFRGGGTNGYPAALKEWDADLEAHASRPGVTNDVEKWNTPYWMLFKNYSTLFGMWSLDQRGSLNAVYAFLRDQGVRWYLPGDAGEIVPKKRNLKLPRVDKIVRPDFAVRSPGQYGKYFGANNKDETLWQLRLGFNEAPDIMGSSYEVSTAHGIERVLARDEMIQAHPEYYAKRADGTRIFSRGAYRGDGLPCLSSPGLFASDVKYVRALFDFYDEPMVSVMMPDGYVSTCQCELCKDKGTPERGGDGSTSDYVWDYVNRVAREVYKTHPDRKISCCSYGSYTLPPTRIDQLSPNIVVGLCQWRMLAFNDLLPEKKRATLRLRQEWLKKLPKGHTPFFVYDYYRYAVPGMPTQFMPVYFPHAIAADLRSLKGLSLGDIIEVYRENRKDLEPGMGITHLNLYVTAQFWWDATQDVDALLNEYYTLFYGPAHAEMKAFIDYSEANFNDLGKNADKIDQSFVLLGKAQGRVEADSMYAKRINLIADYIRPLKDLRTKLAMGRGPVPEARGFVRDARTIKLDGKLDDLFWQGLENSGARLESYALKEVETGRPTYYRTSFKVAYAGDNLYVGIECKDTARASLTNAVIRHDDMAVFDGESVELLLETLNHSYYQLVISPAGGLFDADWKSGSHDSRWNSNAEVATCHDGDSWSAEIRIPIFPPTQEDILPFIGVSGEKPSEAFPWYFNICRHSVHEKEIEDSAFSPTGKEAFQVPLKFGKLYMRR